MWLFFGKMSTINSTPLRFKSDYGQGRGTKKDQFPTLLFSLLFIWEKERRGFPSICLEQFPWAWLKRTGQERFFYFWNFFVVHSIGKVWVGASLLSAMPFLFPPPCRVPLPNPFFFQFRDHNLPVFSHPFFLPIKYLWNLSMSRFLSSCGGRGANYCYFYGAWFHHFPRI